jgi:hypothetical protein
VMGDVPHAEWRKNADKPFSWKMGFISGGWTPSDRDKLPPQNPCQKGTTWEREWQEGFEYRRKLERGEG